MENQTIDCSSLVADAAMLAGTLVLENGGETYRAEETAQYVCRAGGIEDPEIIAIPTGIFLSGNPGKKNEQNGLMRIHQSAMHLYKLERTNAYCRSYVRGDIDIETLYEKLVALRVDKKTISFPMALLISAMTTASFAVMLDGGIHDTWISFVCGLLLGVVTELLAKSTFSVVSVNFVGGIVITLTAVLFTNLIGRGSVDIIIISSAMPLLPGLATLNALRDLMHGDLVSGNARLLKALLIGISIAAGVGLTLSAYISLGGVL